MKLMVKEEIQARGEWGYAGREGGPAAVGCGTVGLTFNFQANRCTVELEEGKVLCVAGCGTAVTNVVLSV
jgi:hypothetical protein